MDVKNTVPLLDNIKILLLCLIHICALLTALGVLRLFNSPSLPDKTGSLTSLVSSVVPIYIKFKFS